MKGIDRKITNGKILAVVVPTYSAENYLKDNLNVFIYEDIPPDVEILVINDGSKDKSLDIAMEYIQRYPDSLNVITKENGSHGSGVSCGIQSTTGKYFRVVDADDWIEADAFKKLLQSLGRVSADVVYSGFLWTFSRGQGDKNLFRRKAKISQPFIGVLYEHNYDFNEIANKLYMKMHNMTTKTGISRKHHILIDENCYYVDTEYITYPIPYIKAISFINEFVYVYRIGRQGQSVGVEKVQQNETNYDKVLRSLSDFYLQLGREMSCSYEEERYIERIIVGVVAGKIKIMLSFPAIRGKKEELQTFDDKLKKNYLDIYGENINKTIAILRKNGYFLYYPTNFTVRGKSSWEYSGATTNHTCRMGTSMIQLRSTLLPDKKVCGVSELYYHRKGNRVDYNEYFSLFYVEKRKKYADVGNLKMSTRLCGYEKLVLVHDGIDVKEVALKPKRYKKYLIDSPYGDYNKGCFWVALYEDKSSPEKGINGYYVTDPMNYAPRKVNIRVDICTFRKEEYVARSLK